MDYLHFLFGVVAMQVVFLIYHFILFRRAAFLYYLMFSLLITLFVGLVFNFGLPLTSSSLPAIERFSYGYSTLFIASAMYYKFIRYMSEAATKYPGFNKLVNWMEWIIIATALLIAGETFISGAPDFSKLIGRIVYVVGLLFQLYLIVYLVRTKILINILIVAGGFIMSLFMKMVLVPIAINDMDLSAMEVSSFVMIGIIVDFLILIFILVYQSRLWELQNTENLIRSSEELVQQRNEISNDLHDDIGASLSSVHVYSTVALNNVSDPESVKLYLEKIRSGVRNVMDKMGDVIWAVKSDNQANTPLSAKLKNYFVEVLDASGITISYDFEEGVEDVLKSMVARKNFLLIAKEAVNNIVKHSGATHIDIKLVREAEDIVFQISDNGRGIRDFEFEKGNGIGNIRYRALQMNGISQFRNLPDSGGMEITIRIPLERAK